MPPEPHILYCVKDVTLFCIDFCSMLWKAFTVPDSATASEITSDAIACYDILIYHMIARFLPDI